MTLIDETTVRRLYRRARAERWNLPMTLFAEALDRSEEKAFDGTTPAGDRVLRYLESLHLEDLALACACAAGNESAWDHFVAVHRPALYRSAECATPLLAVVRRLRLS